MLEPILCDCISTVPLLPKLRGHFAEFLNNTSSVGLRILSSSTCVGLRYGFLISNSGFSRQPGVHASLLFVRSLSGFRLSGGFAYQTLSPPPPVFPFPAHASLLCPHSSVIKKYRILNLLSIDYAFQPRLRSRLTQGRSALPWKPRTFGRKDSHLTLATHSGILPSYPSTAPFGTASSVLRMLPYRSYYCTIPRLRCRVLAPDIFGAGPLD